MKAPASGLGALDREGPGICSGGRRRHRRHHRRSAPAPPPGLGLEGRRLQRGVTAGSASSRRRLGSPEAGSAGGGTALSFPPPAPFPTAGAVEKGVGEGWGREDAGAGQRSSPAPGEGRGCTATAPLPHAPRRDTLRARGCQCRQPVSPASACARRVPSRNRAREKGLKEESLFNDTAGSGYKHQKLQKEDRQLHGRLHEDGKVGHKYNSHSSKTSLRKIHMTMRHTWRVPSNIYLDGWTGPTASQQPGGEGEGRRWALRAPG
nr:uncharacterized protein LOC115844019 [Globicephala melas]